MSTEASDGQLKELLDCTRALLSAADIGDVDEIGRQLEMRRQCLDTIKLSDSASASASHTMTRKALIDEIILLDGKASSKIQELTRKSGETASDYRKKTVGLIKYNKEQYNLTNGQLIDKKD